MIKVLDIHAKQLTLQHIFPNARPIRWYIKDKVTALTRGTNWAIPGAFGGAVVIT